MRLRQGINHIVVGIDEGQASEHALRAGFSLAHTFGARIEVLHATPLDVPRWIAKALGPLSRVSEQLRSAAKESRTRYLVELLGETPHPPLDELLTLVQGKPARAIVDHAVARGADLILLGGRRNAGVFHFGSTARTVLAKSRCPVWVQSDPVRNIETILIAIDMSPNSKVAMRFGAELASRLGARVLAFHSFVPPYFSYDDPPVDLDLGPTYGFEEFEGAEQEHFEEVVADFDWGGVMVSTTFTSGNPAQKILEIHESVDLIVMGTHGRSALARAILGSQAYSVIKQAQRPVLAIPNPEYEYPGGGQAP